MAKAKNKKGGVKANETTEKKGVTKKDVILLKFTRSSAPYIKGDIAGFDSETAKRFIKKEVAIEFKK